MSNAPSLKDATDALQAAGEAHDIAQRNASAARSAETSALNRLNEAQRAFDAAVAHMRKTHGSRDSGWHHAAQPRGTPV